MSTRWLFGTFDDNWFPFLCLIRFHPLSSLFIIFFCLFYLGPDGRLVGIVGPLRMQPGRAGLMGVVVVFFHPKAVDGAQDLVASSVDLGALVHIVAQIPRHLMKCRRGVNSRRQAQCKLKPVQSSWTLILIASSAGSHAFLAC